PQLQHAALRLTPRGWETYTLPARDGSGAIVAALDLRTHEALVEHSDGREARIPLTPNRPVAAVRRDVLDAVARLAGMGESNPTPQEVPWTVPLDEDREHSTYEPDQVATYFWAATQADLVLAEFRAPFRGRATPVNAWWGTFDLAMWFFNGKPADPPGDDFITRNGGHSGLIAGGGGWGRVDAKHGGGAFVAFAYPAPEGFADADLDPKAAHWDPDLGEFVLEWEDIRAEPDPHALALELAPRALAPPAKGGGWDPGRAGRAEGHPPPIH